MCNFKVVFIDDRFGCKTNAIFRFVRRPVSTQILPTVRKHIISGRVDVRRL